MSAVAALDLGPGDEVIMPTLHDHLLRCGGRARRRDARCSSTATRAPGTWTSRRSRHAITPRTRAIMAVHIYGLPVDMDPDPATRARGTGWQSSKMPPRCSARPIAAGRAAASATSATFSFYPNKHVTTGEGGMVVTDDDALAERCRQPPQSRASGPKRRFVHEELGWNFRMTNLQAALGLAQLERLDEFVAQKRAHGRRYTRAAARRSVASVAARSTPTTPRTSTGSTASCSDDDVPFDAEEAMRRLGAKRRRHAARSSGRCTSSRSSSSMGLFAGERYPVAERIARRGFYLPSGLALTDGADRRGARSRDAGGLRVSASSPHMRATTTCCTATRITRRKRRMSLRPFGKQSRRAPLLELGCGTGAHAVQLATPDST